MGLHARAVRHLPGPPGQDRVDEGEQLPRQVHPRQGRCERRDLAEHLLAKVDTTVTAWWAIGLKQLRDETQTPAKTYTGLFEWADAVNVDPTVLPDITATSYTNW